MAKNGFVSVALRQINCKCASTYRGPSVTDPDTVTPVEVFEAGPAAITEDPAASH